MALGCQRALGGLWASGMLFRGLGWGGQRVREAPGASESQCSRPPLAFEATPGWSRQAVVARCSGSLWGRLTCCSRLGVEILKPLVLVVRGLKNTVGCLLRVAREPQSGLSRKTQLPRQQRRQDFRFSHCHQNDYRQKRMSEELINYYRYRVAPARN